MSLSAALSDLYRRLKYSTTPSADITTRLTASLNKAQQTVVAAIGGSRLAHGTTTFASVAGQSEYALPAAVARVLSIRDTANRLRLGEIGEDEYRSWLADPASDTGTPTAYARLGVGTVALRPSAASTVVVVSTSAADTTQTVFADAVDANGRRVAVTAALNGLTGVTLAQNCVEILDMYLSAVTAGNVELHQTTAAGTLLSTIYSLDLRERYQRIALVATPASALTYTVEYEYTWTDLIQATDEFPIPVPFLDCVVERALMYEFHDMGDATRYAIAKTEFKELLGALNDYLVNPPDRVYVPARPMAVPSNLPANYPTSVFRWP